MTRRTFVSSAAVGATAAAPSDSRSVIVLIGDDHSPVAGCYGNRVVTTPNLDTLAARGVKFTNGYCTTASCSASRSVILTGLHNHANGHFGHAHDFHHFSSHEWVQSVPRLARAAGMSTGIIGKLHVMPPSVYDFEHVYGGGAGGGGTRDVWGMARNATDFFKKAGGRPFYLHVGYSDPHRGGDPSGFGNDRPMPNVKKRAYSPADVTVPDFLPDQPEVRRELAQYYEAIDRMDLGIGFFLEALEKSGRAKDTLIVYVGDNGMPFPGAKASLYDSGLRVPMILARPGAAGRSSDALVSTADIAPTALDWLGLESTYPLHGRSMTPLVDAEQSGRDEVYFSHTFHEINNYYPFRAIRTRRWKYVRVLFPELEMPLPSDLFGSPTWQGIRTRGDAAMGQRRTSAFLKHEHEELYDLSTDPLETTNVARENPSVLAELRAKVQQFRTTTKDPWLIIDRQRGFTG
ncbi:MAG TPA: sulfatase [Bryobacteraceae bacterium]|nr:sulfatase [Bryobacteraceae bacterium]